MKAKKKKPVAKKTVKKAVKKAVRKPVKKAFKKTVKKAVKKAGAEKKIGTITHYFPKVRAAVIKLKSPLAVGETIRIKGHTTDFSQTISSMQIDHVAITKAKKGDEIGLLVESRVRRHDAVSKA
jgi:hypothetical protein